MASCIGGINASRENHGIKISVAAENVFLISVVEASNAPSEIGGIRENGLIHRSSSNASALLSAKARMRLAICPVKMR